MSIRLLYENVDLLFGSVPGVDLSCFKERQNVEEDSSALSAIGICSIEDQTHAMSEFMREALACSKPIAVDYSKNAIFT